MESRPKLSDTLPPLIFGTATFNYQFNVDPYALGPTAIVHRALAHGVRAFDTSPYYGPAESILGDAFATSLVQNKYPRESYQILTKVGRLGGDSFDYSAAWVRHSVKRSCTRLRTTYLDVVYCHDVEFVTPAEVLTAITELRRIRDENGAVKYVGICGYPVDVLCDLAEMILRETGEPLDIVQSYANFTIQNTRLLSQGLERFVKAGVDVVPNASPLGMGLLRRSGPPIGALGNWHPAPDGLRQVCLDASKQVEQYGEKLEVISVRFALENWLRDGAKVGARGSPIATDPLAYGASTDPSAKLGVSVMGVSKIEELDETMRVWHSVLDGIADDYDAESGTITPSDAVSDHEWSLHRRQQIRVYARSIREMLGSWADFAWASPDPGFVNKGNPQPIAVQSSDEDQNSILTPPDDEEIAAELGKAPDPSEVEQQLREQIKAR
jgi:aryl-alcohol dehydrogenase-like predicted oxidoreductase